VGGDHSLRLVERMKRSMSSDEKTPKLGVDGDERGAQ